MIPSVGRIVLYGLTEQDAEQINKRRHDAARNRDKHREDALGYVAHVGNLASAGEVYPMVITRVWGGPSQASETSTVNGQVLLDGTDTLWVTSREQSIDDPRGVREGRWFVPPRV